MTDTARFALIQRDRLSWDPTELAKALATVRETPVHDQAAAARRAWGIVADDLSQEEAQELGKALRSAGVECAVGPTAALAKVPSAEIVHSVEALPDAQPVLIAAAGLTITTTTTKKEQTGPSPGQKAASAAIMMTTGLPIKVGGRKKTVQKTTHEQSLVFVADLFYEEPSKRVQIDPSHFDFSCLKGRMLYQGQGNLKLLTGDIAQAAPDAWTNHGARILLEGQPIRLMGYAGMQDLEREERWLLTLRAFGI